MRGDLAQHKSICRRRAAASHSLVAANSCSDNNNSRAGRRASSLARHGTARHGTARHGTARHGTARSSPAAPLTAAPLTRTAARPPRRRWLARRGTARRPPCGVSPPRMLWSRRSRHPVVPPVLWSASARARARRLATQVGLPLHALHWHCSLRRLTRRAREIKAAGRPPALCGLWRLRRPAPGEEGAGERPRAR